MRTAEESEVNLIGWLKGLFDTAATSSSKSAGIVRGTVIVRRLTESGIFSFLRLSLYTCAPETRR